MSRKIAREVAMKLAYARLCGGEDTYSAVLEKSEIITTPSLDDIEYAESILLGIREHEDEISSIISELTIGWSIERMPKVDVSILRIAIFEMLYRSDIPYSVSINEAVELAKVYDSQETANFVNGVLGSFFREERPK